MKIIQNAPISSSPQWLCGDIPTMDDQWQSSRIVNVRTNRVLTKHQASSANILIITQSAQEAKARSIIRIE